MADKLTTEAAAVATIESGMTLGIGGWGSRRKPMSLVRALLHTDVTDLTVVSYGGPDVGLLCAAGKVRKLIYGFVSLDSIALEPHFRNARQSGSVLEVVPREQLREAAYRIAESIAAKSPTVIRAAKESLNGIDLWDVRKSYRFEQGFTFELNLSGVSDELRDAFVEGRDADTTN